MSPAEVTFVSKASLARFVHACAKGGSALAPATAAPSGEAEPKARDMVGVWAVTVKALKTLITLTEAAPAVNHGPHTSDLVRQAVGALPERAREVVVLHYFTGLSHKEIAASLGMSPEAVHGRLVRARRMLAERLTGNGMGEIEL